MRRYFLLVPLIVFAGLAGLFLFGNIRENRNELPSTMIGRDAPGFINTEALADFPEAKREDLPGSLTLVNFWASWCAPCRAEHPFLEELAAQGVRIIGVNYKDENAKGAGFLNDLGNPYAAIAADPTGRTGIEWGIYGVPETFVLDAEGKVRYRLPGPISRDVLENRLMPEIGRAGG